MPKRLSEEALRDLVESVVTDADGILMEVIEYCILKPLVRGKDKPNRRFDTRCITNILRYYKLEDERVLDTLKESWDEILEAVDEGLETWEEGEPVGGVVEVAYELVDEAGVLETIREAVLKAYDRKHGTNLYEFYVKETE
ncbi:MAG: hypothetical protein DRP01_00535 [Archaeoglobales archaeon]|nr:MAG: hypothetical protein DRP01_00535 [Archaeoglobales archaeon]